MFIRHATKRRLRTTEHAKRLNSQSIFMIYFILHDTVRNNYFYYIDTSVLLENIPLVKFIKTTSGTRVVYFP